MSASIHTSSQDDDIPFPTEAVDRTVPQHDFLCQGLQFRAKLRTFSKAPPELTVQMVKPFGGYDRMRYENAYYGGWSSAFPGVRPRRARDPDALPSLESIDRSQRRAKTNVRLSVTELAPSSLVTFTTRSVYALDELLDIWGRFVRLVRAIGSFEYVCVPEPHPSNPDHFHLHAAVRGKISRDNLRRCWHIAIEAHHGRRVTTILRGAASPGNIDDQPVKGRDYVKRIRKIAKYISKYITKDLIERFNRRRYWPSKGINVKAAQVFWLESLDQSEAIREACMMFGWWDGVGPAFKMFRPCEKTAWMAVDPEAIPDPPF